MKPINVKTAVLLLISILTATSCIAQKSVVYRDQYVTVEYRAVPSALLILNAHLSGTMYLTVIGKTYKNVWGSGACYLDLPTLDSILFVTRLNDVETYHIVNIKTKKEIDIDARHGGLCIFTGPKGAPPGHIGQYIDNITPGKITVVDRQASKMTMEVLNLESKTIESAEAFVDDDLHPGKMHHYVNGKEVP